MIKKLRLYSTHDCIFREHLELVGRIHINYRDLPVFKCKICDKCCWYNTPTSFLFPLSKIENILVTWL